MSIDLPIWILEPELDEKSETFAERLSDKSKKVQTVTAAEPIEDIKKKLKQIRQASRDSVDLLRSRFQESLKQLYPQVKVKTATDNDEAVTYIRNTARNIRVVSVNNSSVINAEIRDGLTKNQFTVVNSYLNEYDIEEKKIRDYWDLPRFLDRNLSGTFNPAAKLSGIENDQYEKPEEYVAVLGVNGASADDGTIFFLEHYKNILNDIKHAMKVILVVGLDKIVQNREDAEFQSKCMGTFGMESVVLSIKPKSPETKSLTELNLPQVEGKRELHIIILDNGRTELAKGTYKDLYLCIGCRGCTKHCPIQHGFTCEKYIWTPKNYLHHFIDGKINSIDVCLHCEACRLECPVDIDLPHLMWQAKMNFLSNHSPSLSHRILGSPEILARLATPFAPIANRLMRLKPVRIPMEIITGIDRKTTLPVFHTKTFRKWFKQSG